MLYAWSAPNNLYQEYAWNTLLTGFATDFGLKRAACVAAFVAEPNNFTQLCMMSEVAAPYHDATNWLST